MFLFRSESTRGLGTAAAGIGPVTVNLPATWSLVPLPIAGTVLGSGIDQDLRVTRLSLPLPNSVPERSDSSGYWRAGAGFQFQVSVSIYRRTWYKTFDKLGHRTTQGK